MRRSPIPIRADEQEIYRRLAKRTLAHYPDYGRQYWILKPADLKQRDLIAKISVLQKVLRQTAGVSLPTVLENLWREHLATLDRCIAAPARLGWPALWPCDIIPEILAAINDPELVGCEAIFEFFKRTSALFDLASAKRGGRAAFNSFRDMPVSARFFAVLPRLQSQPWTELRLDGLGISPLEFGLGSTLLAAVRIVEDELRVITERARLKPCHLCFSLFTPRRSTAKYCSPACKVRAAAHATERSHLIGQVLAYCGYRRGGIKRWNIHGSLFGGADGYLERSINPEAQSEFVERLRTAQRRQDLLNGLSVSQRLKKA